MKNYTKKDNSFICLFILFAVIFLTYKIALYINNKQTEAEWKRVQDESKQFNEIIRGRFRKYRYYNENP